MLLLSVRCIMCMQQRPIVARRVSYFERTVQDTISGGCGIDCGDQETSTELVQVCRESLLVHTLQP